jgi:serine/threonine protein kinase
MPAAPDGFSAGKVLVTNDAAEVFEIERDGIVMVCKRLAPRLRTETEMWDAMTRESEILRAVGLPRLVANGDDGFGPYLVMERIESTPEKFDERCAWGALARVHAANVVHGDVSPDNLLFRENDAVLVDFGFARFVQDARIYEGGTALYMAPEVARGELRDFRSDVFSMALVLQHRVTNERPRKERQLAPLLIEAGTTPVEAIPQFAKWLAFDPADRAPPP